MSATFWMPEPLAEGTAQLTPAEELQQLLKGDPWSTASLTTADQRALRHES